MKAKQDRLYADVEFLTTIQPPRNYQNLDSLNRVAEYIYQALEKAGCEMSYQEFQAGGESYKNVIGLVKGVSEERIIVGAHYDVYGDFPGADDNASAVAGMLETARLLHEYRQQSNKKLPYTMEFVGYNLEEPPFFASAEMGSAVHAKYIYDNNIPLKLMICYEMIGYFSDEPGSQDFPDPTLASFFPDKGNFIICAGQSQDGPEVVKFAKAMQAHCDIMVYPVATPFTDDLVGLSDQRCYWDYDYLAVMINDTAFMRNPNYHQPTDTIDTLNFEKMADVVNGTFGGMMEWIKAV